MHIDHGKINSVFQLTLSNVMTPDRKTIQKITKRALLKCTQFYQDAVHAYCTPVEFLALCWYFDTKPRTMEYYANKVKIGDCSPGTHYIHVKKWNKMFPQNEYACLDCCISETYSY